MGAKRIFVDNVALLGSMSGHDGHNGNGVSANGRGSAREIFQHLSTA